ncbi:MAG: hypothetical protein JWQ64_75, partial [Subtercola sp.]|nr:hypothetical protein [Subtercola sp.]
MRKAGTGDGRELVRELDTLIASGTVVLDADGTWQLK